MKSMEDNKIGKENSEHVSSLEKQAEVPIEKLEKELALEAQNFVTAEVQFEEKLANSYSIEEINETKNEIDYSSKINEINSEFAAAIATASPGASPASTATGEAVPFWKQKVELQKKELQETGEIAYDFIREHCKALGIEVGSLSKDVIDWDIANGGAKAHYSYIYNHIMTKSSSLHVLIHEELHYAASAKNSEAGKNAAQQGVTLEKRISKSGFVSTWGESEASSHSNFRSLNEAVTEKMAREILGKNKDRFEEEYKKKFPESVDQKKKFLKKYYDNQKSEWDAGSKDMYEWVAEPGETYEQFYDSKIKEFDKNFEAEQSKIPFNPEVLVDVEKVYQNEINIFDSMLEKLARHRATEENISLEEAQTKEWSELQQAYLKGTTIALRRIDSVIGTGTLREFDEIDYKKVRANTMTRDEYQKKVDDFLVKLNS